MLATNEIAIKWQNWLTSQLQQIGMHHDYVQVQFPLPTQKNSQAGPSPIYDPEVIFGKDKHVIYAPVRKKFLFIPYTGRETVAIILTEPSEENASRSLSLRIENKEYAGEIAKLAGNFRKEFGIEAKVIGLTI